MTYRVWLDGARRMVALAALGVLIAPGTANAQLRQVTRSDSTQAIDFTIGYFAVRGEDSRTSNDVLVADLDSLAFNIKDFNGAAVGGDYLFSIGRFLEAGVGLGYYRRTVPSVYADLVNDDGSEISQDLKLQMVPVTFTARVLPFGRGAAVEPYVGAGVAAIRWKYSEVGDFVAGDNSVFHAQFSADGTAVGPVILGGVRIPVGDVLSIGGEVRYQKAEDDTGGIDNGLLGDRIDLGGWTTNFVAHVRF